MERFLLCLQGKRVVSSLGHEVLGKRIFFFDRQKKKYIREKKKPIEQKDTGSIQKELDKPDQKDG